MLDVLKIRAELFKIGVTLLICILLKDYVN